MTEYERRKNNFRTKQKETIDLMNELFNAKTKNEIDIIRVELIRHITGMQYDKETMLSIDNINAGGI